MLYILSLRIIRSLNIEHIAENNEDLTDEVEIYMNKKTIAIIGLGYVGMPLAIEMAKHFPTIGFDINAKKVDAYKNGIDVTREVGSEALIKTTMILTCQEEDLHKADFFIIAVPTPINPDRTPDLRPVIGASEIVARNMQKGAIVVYESTVYPGVTEEICVPVLERLSGLTYGQDFKVGYSPERINPGDKVHTVTRITKVVSGMDEDSLAQISAVYGQVVEAGVFQAKSIKAAEAAKVIENSQRDINIAFMNELSIIFDKMGIDTNDVLEAAGTKWNFLKFTPGLVGGHCIGVDPYYLTYRAEQLGYHPEVILAGRRINDNMGKYVAENTVKQLIKADCPIKGAKILMLGLTFKEDVPDVRNTKIVDIIRELSEYGIQTTVVDPVADRQDAVHEYGIDIAPWPIEGSFDAVIIAVKHQTFTTLTIDDLAELINRENKVIIDVKGLFRKEDAIERGYWYWRL